MYYSVVRSFYRGSLLNSWNLNNCFKPSQSVYTVTNENSRRVFEKWFHSCTYKIIYEHKIGGWNDLPFEFKKDRNYTRKESYNNNENNRNQVNLAKNENVDPFRMTPIGSVPVKGLHTRMRNPLYHDFNQRNLRNGLLFLNERKEFSTKNIRGRLFYKRRPKQIPILKRKNWRSKWLEGAPQKKGICLKVRVQTPKKPNSGLKKIARVRLSTGRIVSVYIPGIGHNLNTHSIILVRGGRCKDIPGCNYKAVRGVYDLLPVKNRFRGRSKYGVKLSEEKRKHLVERYNFKHITIQKDIEEFNKYKWFNYIDKDKNLREKPLEEGENVPINIFHFNTYYRKKKFQQENEK